MDNNYKYIWNMGLAFDEDKVLKKMSAFAKEGWILKSMTLFRYKFEKSEIKELTYSMDYKELKEDKEEYFSLFNSSGWTHMCSNGPFHFFAAANDIPPIYTDKENYLEKYKPSRKLYIKMLIASAIVFLIATSFDSYSVDKVNNIVIHNVLRVTAIISIGILVPSIMVTVAYIFRLKKH